ncbi:MAG TPA: RHS repeat-associated core domain-containing protein [Streptosporangiaceae bacterium]
MKKQSRVRRVAGACLGPVLTVASSAWPVAAPVAVVVAATGIAATAGVTAKAQAAVTGPVLVLLQNGETTAPETTVLRSAGYTVTQVTPAIWESMSSTSFQQYAALVIGDPSASGTCSTLTPTTATTGSDALGTNWQAAVGGNVALIGTAPALPGTAGANTLITDAVNYAAAGYSSSSQTGTGLYVSLNCEYSVAAARTSVPLLNGVESIGTNGGLTVQGHLSCTDSGTVNTWAARQAGTFGGFTSTSLASGSSGSWPSPACPVQEAFDTWPAMFTPVGFDAATDASADFTASDGKTGQPYLLLGARASAGTQALAPSNGGEVPAYATAGGTSNPAAPGVSSTTAGDPVNTENGDFAQSATDVSIPTYGPSLTFTRSYDAQVAQQQVKSGTPGPMGYGWTDNWASSLATTQPVAGNIYAIGGLATNNGNGGSGPQSVVSGPQADEVDGSGNIYFADTADNRVQEIPVTTGTQWGISMTAGDVYTVAGSPGGQAGASSSTTPAASTLLDQPEGLAVNSSGLYISDNGNCRVIEIAATTGTQWGILMTAGDMYVIAGRTGQCALGFDAKVATQSDLDDPVSLHLGAGSHGSDLYIADAGNNRIQEIAAATTTEWGQSMTATFAYTVAGSSAGTSGQSNNGTKATSAFLTDPQGVTIDGNGNLLIADTANCRVEEVPLSTGTFFGTSMTQFDLYAVAGRNSSSCTIGFDNKAANQSNLWSPTSVRDPNGNLYIADDGNNRVQEVAGTTHTEFGQSMTVNFVYTIGGNSGGTAGDSGDGGAATSALMNDPGALWVDSSGNVYVSDTSNNEIRKISTSTANISDIAGGNSKELGTVGDGGPAVSSGLSSPRGIGSDTHGDIFIADTSNNRVQEIAGHGHIQFGISMTAGDIYTVAGSASGAAGNSGNGGLATSALLNTPEGIAVDSSGNLYIADTNNHQIREVAASTGDISTIAGSTSGDSGNGGPATNAKLSVPAGVAVDGAGDVFLADPGNFEVQEVPASSGTHYGIAMTAGDIYAVDGTPGTSGTAGDGGPAISAQLSQDADVAVDSAGNLYISDTGNNRIQEVAAATHAQWGISMTGGDVYTIAGSATGAGGSGGNTGPAVNALLSSPVQVVLDSAGDLYIDDTSNSVVREIAASSGTQWSQSMTAGDIYAVAGIAGAVGSAGDGGPATSAQLNGVSGIGTDPAGDLFISDAGDDMVQEVTATPDSAIPAAPGQTSSLSPAPGGITVTQPGGAQVTFYAQAGGVCTAPYQVAGGYCALPVYDGASLTGNTARQTYTFIPSAGSDTYTYSWDGQLLSEANPASDTLTITYQSPAPGSGACPATATSCETITAASGRALVIGSNGSGLITSVTDPMGRTWDYGYTNANLTSVTDPMTNVTSYAYGAASTGNPLLASDLLTITSPDAQPGGPDAGDSTVNVYNAAGQVTSQTDPTGFKSTFSYCVNASSGNCMDAATGTGYVTVTDPDGNATVYGYTLGTQASQAAWTAGTALSSEQDYLPAQSASGPSAGTQLDTETVDGLGNATASTFNSAGDATSSSTPDGIGTQAGTTTDSYTSLNQVSCDGTDQAAGTGCASASPPAPVTPGGVITAPSSAPPLGETWTLFDTNGNELYSTTGVYEPGGGTAAYSATTYQLFKGNSVTLNGTTITCTAVPASASLPCATIAANGAVTQLAYNPQGDLTSSSTPDGNGTELAMTTYAYDGDGEQTSVTSPDGNLAGGNSGNYTTITAYTSDGQPKTVTAGGGTGHTVTPRVTTYGYDADGNQASVQDARGFTATTKANADDKPVLVTDPDGNATLTCYDGDGNVAQTVPPAGVANQNLTASSCPTAYPAGYAPATSMLASDATMSTYDGLGQKTAMYTPAPAGQSGFETTTYAYDSDGDLVTTTAPPATNGGANQVTTQTYDETGNLASITTGSGTSAASTTSFCYDPNGDRTAVVAPDGNAGGTASCENSTPYVVSATSFPAQAAYQTTSSYDSDGEVVSSTSPATSAAPSGATTTETYDSSGDTLTRTDPNGVTTTWTYTPQSQPATVSYSGASAHSVSYTYDASGNRTGMTDATGSSTFTYDAFGELTSTHNGAGQTTGYGFNADGQVTGITYPLPASATWATSSTVNYGYDNADLLNSVTDFNNHQISVGNNADGLTNSLGLGSSGDTVTTTYDPTDTPALISLKNSTSTLQSFAYSDAPAGTVLTETDTPSSPSSPAAYTYDGQGRVSSMKPGTGTTLSYGFDPSGNLTTLPTGASGSYDHDSELASSALSGTTTSYTYNADGERLGAAQGGTSTISGSWNGAGQLASYRNTAANLTAATYDGNGDRATATTSSGTQTFTWNTLAAVPQLIMDAGNAYIYAGSTTPVEQVSLSTGALAYLVGDALGSVRGTVSAAGALTSTASYDAWGNPAALGGLTTSTPFGYAGGYTDPDGLIYLVNRYYDPAAGAFISVDPAISQTYQPYAYAGDNPVSRADPTGLVWWTYETFHRLSRISGDVYYDESPNMAGAMANVTGEVATRHIDTITRWLAFISNAIAIFVPSHPHLAAIIGFVSAAVAIVSGRRLVGLIKWVKKWTVGNGKHKGFYTVDFTADTSPPDHFEGTKLRSCPASTPSCGSPADHSKETWPSP